MGARALNVNHLKEYMIGFAPAPPEAGVRAPGTGPRGQSSRPFLRSTSSATLKPSTAAGSPA